jgi:hypothetical protein
VELSLKSMESDDNSKISIRTGSKCVIPSWCQKQKLENCWDVCGVRKN